MDLKKPIIAVALIAGIAFSPVSISQVTFDAYDATVSTFEDISDETSELFAHLFNQNEVDDFYQGSDKKSGI